MESPWARPKEYPGSDLPKDRYRAVVHLATAIQDGLDQWLRGWLPKDDHQHLADAMIRFSKYIGAGKEKE